VLGGGERNLRMTVAIALVEEMEEDTGIGGRERRVIERGKTPEKRRKGIERRERKRERESVPV